jgi:hypothetical protein
MKDLTEDRQISSRINQSQIIRIRPAETHCAEEIRTTLDVSWGGIYFATSIGHYFCGMAVYVTRDFHSNDPSNREVLGTVVRVDKLKEGRWGVAVDLRRTTRG